MIQISSVSFAVDFTISNIITLSQMGSTTAASSKDLLKHIYHMSTPEDPIVTHSCHIQC